MRQQIIPLLAFIKFEYKNYFRQHRYLRDLVAIVIFIIMFEAFLTSEQITDNIWLVFAVFALILNLLTAPSVFFLEKGNTLHFLLSKPNGRRNLLLSKILLIVMIDLLWVTLFACIYGLRFLSLQFFLSMPLKLLLVGILLLLSTLLLSLVYTYKPQLSWLIMIVLIFGYILPKGKLFPLKSFVEVYKVLALLLPPFTEITDLMVSIGIIYWRPGFLEMGWSSQLLFLLLAIIQILLLGILSYRLVARKDMV